MAQLIFDNVTLKYPIYNTKSQSIRNHLIRVGTGGKVSAEAGNNILVTALSNVSFKLNDRDSVGLIGHNGAGKTTLLRTMAGIYSPTEGTIISKGHINTIIETGAGIDLELSGYENIIRMGLLLGSTYKEITARIPDIEKFTELGNFLQIPVRTYSAGMIMRLMFAVATSVSPEILLIDELFDTGDAAFQKKANTRMQELIKSAKIFVFASHNLELIKKYCNRIFKLEHGIIQEISLKEV